MSDDDHAVAVIAKQIEFAAQEDMFDWEVAQQILAELRKAGFVVELASADHVCRTCHAHWNKHASGDLSCPAYTTKNGSVVFSDVHRYSGELPNKLT